MTKNGIIKIAYVSQNSRAFNFGVGLAEGSENREKLWNYLYGQFKNSPADKRELRVLQGFISYCSENDNQLADKILDSSVKDPILGEYYPLLEIYSKGDKRCIERLHESLDAGIANVFYYQNLAYGRTHEAINDQELSALLEKIAKKDKGIPVAMEIINMRFHEKSDPSKHSAVLLNAIRNILKAFNFSTEKRGQRDYDYRLKEITRTALAGEDGKPAAKEIINNFLSAVSKGGVYSFDYPDFLNKFAAIQPRVFLDSVLDNKDLAEHHHRRLFSNDFDRNENPLNQISETLLIEWCEEDPAERYPLIASAIQVFTEDKSGGEAKWKDIIYTIFQQAPKLTDILNNLADAIVPMSWSGSRATIMDSRKILFSDLFEHENEEIRSWAREQYAITEENIRKERQYELSRSRDMHESFE